MSSPASSTNGPSATGPRLAARWVVFRDRALRTPWRPHLDLVGLAVRAPHRDADAILRGLRRHP